MRWGRTKGKQMRWHENGQIKLIGECEFGRFISFKEWDENGNLINEQIQADEETMDFIKRLRKRVSDGTNTVV